MNTPKEAVILGLVGAGGLAFAVSQIHQSFSRRHWQQTTGRVMKSEVRRTAEQADGSPTIDVLATYSYIANGRTFTGDRLGLYTGLFGHTRMSRALEHMKRLAPGAEIPVWFDPANPADAVADKSVPVAFWAIAGLGLLFVVGALNVLFGSAAPPAS